MEAATESSDHQTDPARDDGASVSEAGPLACNSCRKRKLRCSRETPACQQCRRTASECTYETKRVKPGMRAGAIENLHRRLDTLERTVRGQTAQLASLERDGSSPESTERDRNSGHSYRSPDANNEAYGILSFFARELQRFNSASQTAPSISAIRTLNGHANKRRRLSDDGDHPRGQLEAGGLELPDFETLDAVLRIYFSHIHPWIPMLHEGRLRRRLSAPSELRKLEVVLQAIIVATSKYVEDEELASELVGSPAHAAQIRDYVVSSAMKGLSVENLQALIITAFTDIGDGNASQAWSLIASLTRTVEYLQLTVEDVDSEKQALCQPFTSLNRPQDWTEAEERRRVFWTVFNLDRFCSVTTGWNTSLTADDVNCRLPCDGITWRKEDPVATPYFGIWDRSAGRIGNPIAFLPSHYAVPSQHAEEDAVRTPSDAGTSPAAPSAVIDMSTVGAFAYCVEATESLSRINTYFLQQKTNLRDQRDLSSWLTRFKELDLRLVHWKMFLPQKWKIAKQPPSGSSRMDPNLTLAHVTHNASMILLHQLMAFPPLEWPFRNRLPSLLSADTCQAAAVEIATITENYLRTAPATMPLANQFAFCVYVAARVLLIRWQHNRAEGIPPQFRSLVRSLNELARRWTGLHDTNKTAIRTCLAARYSQTLRQLHSRCTEDDSFSINVVGYTTEVDHSRCDADAVSEPAQTQDTSEAGVSAPYNGVQIPIAAPDGVALSLNPTQPLFRGQDLANAVSSQTPIPAPAGLALNGIAPTHQSRFISHSQRGSVSSPDVGAISQMLLDQQFMDMDRIISYDDGIFGAEYDSVQGW